MRVLGTALADWVSIKNGNISINEELDVCEVSLWDQYSTVEREGVRIAPCALGWEIAYWWQLRTDQIQTSQLVRQIMELFKCYTSRKSLGSDCFKNDFSESNLSEK